VNHLIPPHGGTLVGGLVTEDRIAELKQASRDWPSLDLSPVQICDLELILNGGYSPLAGFMGPTDHASVCAEMRLAAGTLWPIPVTLDVPDGVADGVKPGELVALRDSEGVMLAAVTVEVVWEPDRDPVPCPPRLSRAATDAVGAAAQLRPPRVAPRARLSDPSDHAQVATGVDRAIGSGSRGKPPDTPRRRPRQAGRS
jgi:hypothetical protein